MTMARFIALCIVQLVALARTLNACHSTSTAQMQEIATSNCLSKNQLLARMQLLQAFAHWFQMAGKKRVQPIWKSRLGLMVTKKSPAGACSQFKGYGHCEQHLRQFPESNVRISRAKLVLITLSVWVLDLILFAKHFSARFR